MPKQIEDALIGASVMVFEDPFTRMREEGRATVRSVITSESVNGCNYVDCWVAFDDDEEPEECLRTIAYV